MVRNRCQGRSRQQGSRAVCRDIGDELCDGGVVGKDAKRGVLRVRCDGCIAQRSAWTSGIVGSAVLKEA